VTDGRWTEGKGGVKVQHNGIILACTGLKRYVAGGRKDENDGGWEVIERGAKVDDGGIILMCDSGPNSTFNRGIDCTVWLLGSRNSAACSVDRLQNFLT
jgi:hypothetical protein